MIRAILLCSFMLIANQGFSQHIEKAMADSVCSCLNNIDIAAIITPEQKDAVLKSCFEEAAQKNEQIINSDKNVPGNKNYDSGKDYDGELGKKVGPVLMNECERYKYFIPNKKI